MSHFKEEYTPFPYSHSRWLGLHTAPLKSPKFLQGLLHPGPLNAPGKGLPKEPGFSGQEATPELFSLVINGVEAQRRQRGRGEALISYRL